MNDLFAVLGDPALQQNLLRQTGEHITLSLAAVGLAILAAVPLGIVLTRLERFAEPVMAAVSVLQTLPSLALLAFMIPLLGIGRTPALVALFLYALLPILRNTYTGLREVPANLREAGRGMGMSNLQLLRMVELPVAFPVILTGIRTSAVMVIGWATLAAFVGGGGLGDTILTGFAMVSTPHILAGGIPVTLLALLTDFLLGRLERAGTRQART